MSLDLDFLAATILSKSVKKAVEKGITPDVLKTNEGKIWKFVLEYWDKYGSVPSVELISKDYGVKLDPVTDASDYYIDEIRNRKLFEDIQELVVGLDQDLTNSKIQVALDKLREFVGKQDKLWQTVDVVNIFSLVDDALQLYREAKLGKMGIPTPWNRMNILTGGWCPGDVSWFVGRSGSGKTWSAILCALAAWRKGYKVLFVSGEMKKLDIGQRLFSIESKKAHALIRKGKLDQVNEEMYFKKMEELKQCKGIDVMDASDGANIRVVDVAIDQFKPDLVIIDAVYRFKPVQKSRDRYDSLSLLADDVKSMSSKRSVPTVATTQLNRGSVKDKSKKMTPGTEDVAMSDVIGWNASNMFGLVRDEEQKAKNQMSVFPMKIRENENTSEPMVVNWDMFRMDFSEVGEFTQSSYSKYSKKKETEVSFQDDDNPF